MEELRKIVSLNPKDYDSMYELAEIEAEYKEFEVHCQNMSFF